MQRKWKGLIATAAGVALLAACTDATGVGPASARDNHLPVAPLASGDFVWDEEFTGSTGPGALYALYKPPNWNRNVVYLGHGFIDAALPVELPTGDNIPLVRDQLGALGYAVAYTSFSENGYAFADGVRRMHQLRGLVASRFGPAAKHYLMGYSLGAQISQALAETKPDEYNGALLMCGVVGGTTFHFSYLGDIRNLFDFFYPNVLPGGVDWMPSGVNPYTDIIPPALAAITANPTGAGIIMQLDQTPIPGSNLNEKIQALLTALVWHARGVDDLLNRVHGNLPYDNVQTVYSTANPDPALAGLLAGVNATIDRYDATDDAVAWALKNYEPSGLITFPVLTLHTTMDQSVPFGHEARYAEIVNTAGTSNWLVQRSINRFGHCNFTVAEVVANFADLANWVENGVKPTP
jgi:pimeloyl-ACP methyl ester carboxylesterase